MPFRYFLQSWLQGAVQQKVRDTLIDAAREQLQGGAAQGPGAESAERPEICHAGVIFALGIEAAGLEDLLAGMVTTQGHGFVVRQGGLAGRHVGLVLSGPGRENAAKATEALVAGHHPLWVISAGFAGGLDPRLRRSDILMVDHVVDTQGNQLTLDLKIDPAALAESPGIHVGRLLTADRVVRLPDEKQALGRQYHALAVDMETFAVAEVCHRRQVRFLAVRVINDAAGDELPRDVERLLAQKTGAARLGAAIGAIWRRPGSVKDLFKLKENALVASDRLAKFLAGMIETLFPPAT